MSWHKQYHQPLLIPCFTTVLNPLCQIVLCEGALHMYEVHFPPLFLVMASINDVDAHSVNALSEFFPAAKTPRSIILYLHETAAY